ncbi:hypothetical protein [Emticicia oligotrophica]|uniref:hypothetical protein n=1 Tax=Emticicia oligotrophica TaxID=312279 RepID=UPI00273B3AE9|nr:hypothetical protein [Emticicia oligotrophica]
MKTLKSRWLLISTLMYLSISCVPKGLTIKEYGFFHGVLHGFTIILSVIGKIFGKNDIYATNNSGIMYVLGFCGGFSIFLALLYFVYIFFTEE